MQNSAEFCFTSKMLFCVEILMKYTLNYRCAAKSEIDRETNVSLGNTQNT